MATKRAKTSRYPTEPYTLMNANTGEMTQVLFEGDVKEFVIGRSPSCKIIIEEPYVSRRHAVIKPLNNECIIYDCNTNAGTFINSVRIGTRRQGGYVLKHGDLISFRSAKGQKEIIYKFCFPPNVDKKLKTDMKKKVQDANAKIYKHKKNYQKTLTVLYSKATKIRAEHTEFRTETVSKLDEFKQILGAVQENTKKFTADCNSALEKLNGQLIRNIAKSVGDQSFKSQVTSFVENDLHCSICNEMVINNRVLGCSHTFCEYCLLQWMDQNPRCPICRKLITFTFSSLAMNNFVTNMSTLMTATARQERTCLINERNEKVKNRRNQAQSSVGSHAHDHAHVHDHAHAHDHAHVHDRDHAHVHDRDHAHVHDRAHAHVHDRAHAHVHDRAHVHVHDRAHVHVHDRAHAHVHDRANDHVHAHEHVHAHVHDRANDHAHDHVHTHAQPVQPIQSVQVQPVNPVRIQNIEYPVLRNGNIDVVDLTTGTD